MTSADHFIKRELRVPYYIRYMDDMIFLVPSKEQAHEVLGRFQMFLEDRLGLVLNQKTCIVPVSYTHLTAGPKGAYEYWAKSVSSEIADVCVIQPRQAITDTYPCLLYTSL